MIGALIVVHPSTVPALLIFWCFTHGYVFTGSWLLLILVFDAIVTIRMKLEEFEYRRKSTLELEADLDNLPDDSI